jgi:peptide subunit release factor 1 (eRF1)
MAELEITCPRTRRTVPTGIAIDVQSLVSTWALTLKVKCPHCGKEHETVVREAYVDGVMRDAKNARAGTTSWMQAANSV